MMHLTRVVIFESQKYDKGGYSNEYVSQAPPKIQTMIGHHRDQGILGKYVLIFLVCYSCLF